MTATALCIADEDAALAFLSRAIPALLDAGIVPASLNLLDSLAANPAAYGIAERKPDLLALAAEWTGVRANVIAALDTGAPDGAYDFGFRVYAQDDTEHWNLAGTPLDGIRAFSLYVIREGERTYVCSMSPSSFAYGLENEFAYPDQSDEPKVNGYGQSAIEAYMDGEGSHLRNEGVEDTYFGYFGDRDALDRREAERGDVSERVAFDVSALAVDLSALADHAGSPVDPDNGDAFRDMETLAAAFAKAAADEAWEDAKEYFAANAVHPRVLLDA